MRHIRKGRQFHTLLYYFIALLCVIQVGLTHCCAQSVRSGRQRRGVVASVHPLATKAGLQAFQAGGNAIDAAIATGLTLGVVDGHNSGIGGGCFILIRRSDGSLLAIDGREMAPAKAHRDMFVRDGKADTKLSQMGALASGVPGALAAYDLAVRKAGREELDHMSEH